MNNPVSAIRVACIGEVMIEVTLRGGDSARLSIAGDTYNTAAYLKANAPAIEVSYVTVLGSDSFSDRILRDMLARDIETCDIICHPKRMPGLYAIETDRTGERRFSYWRTTSAARTMFDEDGREPAEVIAHYSHILISGITLAILTETARNLLCNALKAFRAKGGVVVFDSNYRPQLWDSPATARGEMEKFWRCTDIGLPSLDDEIALFGDADETAVTARLRSWGVLRGSLKRGGAGPVSLGPHDDEIEWPAAETVVDTTAAGDGFNAGYLLGELAGCDPGMSMRIGHELARTVIGQQGAIVDADWMTMTYRPMLDAQLQAHIND